MDNYDKPSLPTWLMAEGHRCALSSPVKKTDLKNLGIVWLERQSREFAEAQLLGKV